MYAVIPRINICDDDERKDPARPPCYDYMAAQKGGCATRRYGNGRR